MSGNEEKQEDTILIIEEDEPVKSFKRRGKRARSKKRHSSGKLDSSSGNSSLAVDDEDVDYDIDESSKFSPINPPSHPSQRLSIIEEWHKARESTIIVDSEAHLDSEGKHTEELLQPNDDIKDYLEEELMDLDLFLETSFNDREQQLNLVQPANQDEQAE